MIAYSFETKSDTRIGFRNEQGAEFTFKFSWHADDVDTLADEMIAAGFDSVYDYDNMGEDVVTIQQWIDKLKEDLN